MKVRGILFFIILFSAWQASAKDEHEQIIKAFEKRFDVLNKQLEHTLVIEGGHVDSSACIQLLQLAQDLNNDSLLAISYNWIGNYFTITKGDPITAMDYFFKVIPIAERLKDKRRISSIYFDISLIYFQLQNNREALKYILKGKMNLPDKDSDMYDFMLIQFQRNMTQYYLLEYQGKKALDFSNKMYATSIRLKSRPFQYAALYLKGSACIQLKEMDSAKVYFDRANRYSNLIMSNSDQLRFRKSYVDYLISTGDYQKALAVSRNLCKEGFELKNNDFKVAAAGFLAKIFEHKQMMDSAYYYSNMETEINKSIYNQQNIDKINALVFNEKLRRIEEEAFIARQEEARKLNLQYVLLAIGISFFIGVYVLATSRFRIPAKVIKYTGIVSLLLVFEFLNLLLHPFLEKITHHSPLQILLILVGIAALLIPLHHRAEKWAIRILMEKNERLKMKSN